MSGPPLPPDPTGAASGAADDDPGVTRIERPAWDRRPGDPTAADRASWEVPQPYRIDDQAFRWSTRRQVPILGIALLVLGLALLLDQLTPISFSAIVLGALAAVFAAAWIIWRARWAVTPTIVLTALFVPDLLADLGVLSGDGWTSISLAIAFGLVWLIGRSQGRRRRWPLWLAIGFGLIGVTQISDQVPWLPDLDVVWPIVFILVGAAIVFDARRRSPAT
ncbi:MAG: hypothetical protein ACHQ02_06380 [Candidatus Limnocylindrales bacterium]|jgi:hypothetical protein